MDGVGHRRAGIVAVVVAAAAVVVVGVMAAVAPEPELRVLPRPGKPGRFDASFEVMGTVARFEVAAASRREAERMLVPAVARARHIEDMMSTYRPDSEVSRLNRQGAAGPVPVSDDTRTVLLQAVEMARLTGGAFDVTYAPLRTLWRKAAAEGRVPSQEDIDRARAAIGSEKLLIGPGGVRFAVPGMEVDLGGIAKGYAVDMAAEALQKAGAKSGIVDIGGDLRLFGTPPEPGHWLIQVRRPPDVEQDYVLRLPSCGVRTSGDYERGFSVGDKRYSHIVDPRTGWPVGTVPSATVIALGTAQVNGLSAGISVLGAAEGVRLIDSLPDTECMIMERLPEGGVKVHMSDGFAQLVEGS
jgi:thiamine biosynthesis lipoprotein